MNPLGLTAYERYGTVGKEEYKEYFKTEYMYFDETDIPRYNEYLASNGDDIYMDDDILYSYLNTLDSVEAVRMTYYGKFNFADNWHQINGAGNIDSYTETQIVKKMVDDDNFKEWLIEQDDLIDFEDEEVTSLIAKANEYIRLGY